MKIFVVVLFGIFVVLTNANPAVLHSDRHVHTQESDYLPQPPANKLHPREANSDFWLNQAKSFVDKQVNKEHNKNVAKNIIIFLGDAMSTTTLAATRVYMGGEEVPLNFENFPSLGMVKTYCVDYQVADSACSATAYLSGAKANYGTIGVTAQVARYNCTPVDPAHYTSSIASWAMAAGKDAGFVSTTPVTDASVSSLYGHSANRNWENDVDVSSSNCDPNLIDDMAEQLVHGDVASRFKVIFGGGRQHFRNSTVLDEENAYGWRSDGRDLIDEWQKKKEGSRAAYVWNTTELMSINPNETDYVLGLFEAWDMRYNLEVIAEGIQDKEPTIAEMTTKAIEILSKNENGYFLMVEAGNIDIAHHFTYARIALDETAEFTKAIDVARAKTSETDTLIIVTADHSASMSYAGYPHRGQDILGVAEKSNEDGLPYMTLSYTSGPGYENQWNETSGSRIDLSKIDITPIRFTSPTTFPEEFASHTGEDVSVHAIGPWAHLFHGISEQSTIPYKLAYAACIGDDKLMNACN